MKARFTETYQEVGSIIYFRDVHDFSNWDNHAAKYQKFKQTAHRLL